MYIPLATKQKAIKTYIELIILKLEYSLKLNNQYIEYLNLNKSFDKKSIKIIKFLFVLFSISSFGQEVFKNPILAGGYPDPSICKVGDTFYLVNSSFEYFPGLPIHKSTDLINWELIGHGLHRESQVSSTVNLVDVQSNGGIHAPTIRYNKGAVSYTHLTLPTNREV